jgi:uncharacterized protein (TIGR02391 family)
MGLNVFNETQLHQIATALDSAYSHRTLSSLFRDCGIAEKRTEENVKSKSTRVVVSLLDRQHEDRSGNHVGAFIEAVMSPGRFIDKRAEFEDIRQRLNEMLSFMGLTVGGNGKLATVTHAKTLTEAAQRAGRFRKLLAERRVHADVLRFCREELLHDNYFHAVFEATKSVADKIRSKSGSTKDGSELVDEVFAIRAPLLAINTLRSDSEQSEHKGLANLIKGLFGTFRNVTAHAPKITWIIDEEDALDLFSMASYMHRRLDRATPVPKIT